MKKRYLIVNFLLLMSAICMNAQQSITQTYSLGDIPTSFGDYDATCNGSGTTLSVSLPAGGPWEVTSVDVAYDMTAQNGAYMSEQRSKIEFLNTGVEEASDASGSGTGGTYSYSRTLSLVNGYFNGGTQLQFAMHAYRTWGSAAPNDGCGTYYNKVDNNTWQVTVNYQMAPSCIDPQMLEATALSSDSIELDWDPVDSSYSSWVIEYGAAGFTQGSGTSVTVSSIPYTITGLSSSTDYDFYVQSDCGTVNGTSNFVGPVSGTTLADCSIYSLAVNSTTAGSVCGEGSVTLGATVSGTGTDTYWYDAANGGNYLGSGATFETPEIDQNTSFWVSEVVSSGVTLSGVGKAAPVSSNGAAYTANNYGLIFDVTTAFVLQDVEVYPTGSGGSATIVLEDSSGNVLASVTTTIPAGAGATPFTIPLNFSIPTGTGYVLRTTSGTQFFRENSGVNFPYSIGSVGSITSSAFPTSATSTYYYFFYNWTVSTGEVVCESPRTEVIATVNNVADNEITSIPYTDTDNTANFDNNYFGSPGSNCSSSDDYLDGNDVVYHYESISGQVVDIELTGITGNDASVFVYESCDEIGDACLAGAVNTGVSTDFSIDEFVMNDNTDYYIVVSSSGNPSTISYTLNINQSTINCANFTDGPEANDTVYFESGDTLADLDVTGANLTWYTDAAGTTSVPNTTVATDATTYYVSQTLNGCESNLVEVDLVEVDCSNFGITNVSGDTITCFGTGELDATSTGNGTEIYWYESSTSEDVINRGSSFETPTIYQTTSYWVSEVLLGGMAPVNVGANPLAQTGGSNAIDLSSVYATDFYYLNFDVLINTTLTSVDIYPSDPIGSSGSIRIEDSSGTLVQEVPYVTTVTNSSVSSLNVQTVQLNVPLVGGQSYRIVQGNTLSLYRSTSGANFPYTSTVANITGSNFSNAGYYYFFYNFQFGEEQILCESPRQEVIAIVSQTGDKAVSALPYNDSDDTSNFGDTFSGAPGSGCGSSENYLNGDETIYTYTATTTESIDITLSNLSGFYAGVFVYESCSDIGSGCVAGAVAGPSDDDFGISAFPVTAGQDYYIVVSSWLSPSIGYTLDIVPFTCASLETPTGETPQQYIAGSDLSDLVVNETRSGATLNWYSDAALNNSIPDTTVLVDGASYYLTQTFEGCESSAIEIVVNEIDCSTIGIVSAADETISCRGSATLEAVASGNETEVRWYDAATGGNMVETGTSYDTPEVTQTTSYWVNEVIIFNGVVACESTRVEVVVTVTESGDVAIDHTMLPYLTSDNTANYGNDFSGDPGTDCSGTNFLDGFEAVYEYTADPSNDDILDINLSNYTKFNTGVFIYDSCGDIGDTCVTGAVNDLGEVNIDNYYINAGETIFILVTSDSGTTNYDLEINGIDCANVELPLADTQPYFIGATMLSDLGVSGNPYSSAYTWYSDAAGTMPITDPSTETIVDGQTYYVTQTILGCESATLAITPQEFPCSSMGTSNVMASESMICTPGGEVTFTAESTGIGSEVYWYDDQVDGNVIGVGNSFTTNITSTTTVYAAEIFTSGAGNAGGGAQAYCVPSYSTGCTVGDNIDSFNMSSAGIIHNNTGCSSGAYGDYTGDATLQGSMTVGSTYNFSITHGYSGQFVAIFIDFDNNGSFDDAGELLFTSSSGSSNTTGSITIPTGIQGGMKRMRVVDKWLSGTLTSCGSYSYGETHDYSVMIGGGSASTASLYCESARQAVTVTVNDQIPFAPTGFTLQEFCESDFDRPVMIQDLQAVGNDIQWYTSAQSTNPLSPTTVLGDGQIYYASQTVSVCESDSRLNVTVNIIEASEIPVGATNQSFSQGETVADIDVAGTNLVWYLDEDKTMMIPDITQVDLEDQETYYVSQNLDGYCESELLAVTVHETLNVGGQELENLVYYPNPVKHFVNISNGNQIIEQVEIFNLLGQKVMSEKIQNTDIRLELTSLESASYIMKVTTEDGKVGLYKLLKE